MKNPFLASLGNEIRLPVTSLIGMTERLLESELTPDQRSMAEVTRDAAEALLELIGDMVVLSGIPGGHLKLERVKFDLAGMIGTVTRLYAVEAKQCGLRLDCHIEDEVPQTAMGDPGRLRHVLAALIGNAVKFTESGSVTLAVGVEPGQGPSHRVRFSVRDTGHGIAPEKVQSILNEPGQVSGAAPDSPWDGEGAGLAITQLILVLMESHLEIKSEPGKGSEFSFVLELPRAESGEPAPRPDNWLHLDGARVLLVGDSPGQRRTIGEMLGWAGVSVDGAGDSDSALAALSTAGAGDRPYQMVIIESYLPGADGFDLALKINEMNGTAGLPLMVLSSGGEPGDAERCRKSGVSAYLSKPISRIELLQVSALLLAAGGKQPLKNMLITRYSMEENRPRLRVLMVDDSPVNRQVTAAMLHRRGHHVDAVGSISLAVQRVASTEYDAILAQACLEGQQRLAEAASRPLIAMVNRDAEVQDGSLRMPPDPMELFAAVERWGIPAISSPPVHEHPEPSRNRPPVDMDELVRIMRDAGIEDTVGPILKIFIDDAPARMSALEEAASRGDSKGMVAAAHVFYSSSGSVKADVLAGILKEIEKSGMAGDGATAAGLVAEARREYDAVAQFLQISGRLVPAD